MLGFLYSFIRIGGALVCGVRVNGTGKTEWQGVLGGASAEAEVSGFRVVAVAQATRGEY